MKNNMDTDVRQSGIQSINRAVQILKCFENSEVLKLADISRMTGLYKSTAMGIISTLEKNGFLARDGEMGHYRLGVELFRLGNRVNMDLRRIATPSLDTLAVKTGETVNLAVRDRDCVVYIDKRESVHFMCIAPSLGCRYPLYAVATGKTILAQLPEGEVLDVLSRADLSLSIGKAPLTEEVVMEQLREIRRCGYAASYQETDCDRVVLAAPICDFSGTPVAAVSVEGPVSRMSENICTVYVRYIMECAQEISCRL